MPDVKIPVSFNYGNLANLPAQIINGQLLVTLDEGAIYLDANGARKRLGDFQTVANLAALPASAPETALFLVEDLNVLARWDGEKWDQINRDTGATGVTVTGDGNAVTAASYNADTRTITLTKGVTFAVPQDIADAISELDLANTYYSKTAGDALAGQVSGILDGEDIDSFADVEAALGGKQDTIPDNTYDAYGAAAAVLGEAGDAATANTVYGAKAAAAAAQSTADGKVASVTAGNNGVVVGGTATAPTVGVKLSPKTGNALSIETGEGEEGLFFQPAAAQVVSVAEKATPNTGYLKSYQVTVDGTAVGVDIDIPKDFLVKSATSGVVTTADKAEGGKFHDDASYAEGDAYLDFVINVKSGSATDEHVYVNVTNLVDVYTNGDGLNLANNQFSIKLDATNANGLAVDAAGLKIGIATDSVAGAMSAADHQKLHEHANKALLDTYTQTEADLADAVTKKHSHANAAVLDGLTATQVTNWDGEVGAKAAAQAAQGDATQALADAAAAQGDVDDLADLVGELPAGATATTVVEYIDEAIESAEMVWGTF